MTQQLTYDTFDYSKHDVVIVGGFLDIYIEKALQQPSYTDCIAFLKVPENLLETTYKNVLERIRNHYGIIKMSDCPTEEVISNKILSTIQSAITKIDDTKLSQSSAKELAVIVSTLIDKHRLINNKSTENVQINQLTALINGLENNFVPKDIKSN